jgi:hypothetical protein
MIPDMLSPSFFTPQSWQNAIDIAEYIGAHYLVTGNTRHFPFSAFEGIKILSPANFAWILMEYLGLSGRGERDVLSTHQAISLEGGICPILARHVLLLQLMFWCIVTILL